MVRLILEIQKQIILLFCVTIYLILLIKVFFLQFFEIEITVENSCGRHNRSVLI